MKTTIKQCLVGIEEMTNNAIKMRAIIDDGDKQPSRIRYEAIIIEEHSLELIARYVKMIEDIKQLTAVKI